MSSPSAALPALSTRPFAAQPAFQLPSGCTRRLQSLLEVLLAEYRPTGPTAGTAAANGGSAGSGDSSGAVNMSAAELVDVLWGLDVLGQRPSDAQLNLLVILGTVGDCVDACAHVTAWSMLLACMRVCVRV